MLSVLHDWHQQLEEKKEVYAAFFDLWKAFDTIPHLPLMHKSQTLGVESYPLKWNHIYLTNRRQFVDKQKTMCCCGWHKIQCDPSQFWCATRLCSWTTIIILMECKVLQFPTALLYSMQMTWSCIRESVDSLCRDGADTPIVRVHRKAFLTRERSRSKPFWAPSYSIPVVRYPTIPPR